MKKTFIFLVLLIVMSGCMTAKKREDIFYRYTREHPEKLLELCPPINETIRVGKSDTVTRVDTLIISKKVPVPVGADSVECPDVKERTVYKTIIRTDTLVQENTAQIEVLRLQIKEKERITVLLDESKKTARNWKWVSIGLIVLIVYFLYKKRG